MYKTALKHYNKLEQNHLTKNEITYMLSYVNQGKKYSDGIRSKMLTRSYNIAIDAEHSEQGLAFLKKTFLKKNGDVRNTKYIAHIPDRDRRAIATILQNFSEFRLVGFDDVSSNMREYYRPIWRCYDIHGNYFDYLQQSPEFSIMSMEYKPHLRAI